MLSRMPWITGSIPSHTTRKSMVEAVRPRWNHSFGAKYIVRDPGRTTEWGRQCHPKCEDINKKSIKINHHDYFQIHVPESQKFFHIQFNCTPTLQVPRCDHIRLVLCTCSTATRGPLLSRIKDVYVSCWYRLTSLMSTQPAPLECWYILPSSSSKFRISRCDALEELKALPSPSHRSFGRKNSLWCLQTKPMLGRIIIMNIVAKAKMASLDHVAEGGEVG